MFCIISLYTYTTSRDILQALLSNEMYIIIFNFLLSDHGNPYFLLHNFGVQVIPLHMSNSSPPQKIQLNEITKLYLSRKLLLKEGFEPNHVLHVAHLSSLGGLHIPKEHFTTMS